jgi:polyphenol oxidase
MGIGKSAISDFERDWFDRPIKVENLEPGFDEGDRTVRDVGSHDKTESTAMMPSDRNQRPGDGSPGMPTRRDVLLGAGVATGAAFGLANPGTRAARGALDEHPQPAPRADQQAKAFEFKAEPPRLRKSFHDLTEDELKLYCLAVGYMRNGSKDKPLTLEDPRQWDRWAVTHANHCTGKGFFQVHWSWYFLPWHRGFLFFLERQLANILTTVYGEDGSKFALPYWDWTNHKEVPNTKVRYDQGKPSPFFGYDLTVDSLSDTMQVNGHPFDNLALWDGYRGPTLQKPAMTPENENGPIWKQHTKATMFYTDPVYINSILRFPFDAFAGGEVISRDDGQGLLEAFSHNFVHDWVGSRYGSNRDMGTLRYAALDPIFYLHHGNLDRIWSLYTYTPDPDSLPNWAKQAFEFTDIDGGTVSITVKDTVMNMKNVRYVPPGEATPATRAILASGSQIPKEPPREKSETVVERGETLTGKPLTLTATTAKEGVRAIVARGVLPERPALSLLEIQVGAINYEGRFTVRIFVNKDDADINTSIDDPHFVGHIEALDSHAGHRKDEHADGASHKFRVNVSKGVSNFYNVVVPGQPFKLTLVPTVPASNPREFKLEVKSVALKVFE